MAVHQRHVELELKVGERAQPADDGGGLLLAGELDEQAVEADDIDVGQALQVFLDQLDPPGGGEKRGLGRIDGDGDADVAEQLRGALEHIQMAVGEGVEGPGINAEFHAANPQ